MQINELNIVFDYKHLNSHLWLTYLLFSIIASTYNISDNPLRKIKIKIDFIEIIVYEYFSLKIIRLS